MSEAARSSLRLSAMTMVSRILGLIRDHYQAVFFGTGATAVAWEIAYLLPNMLRNLLAEGILAQAFIPIYSDSLRQSSEEARRAAGAVLGFLFLLLLCLVGLGILLFPYLLPLYTGRTAAESTLLVQLAQIMFVFILTASLSAIFAGIANTHHFFTVPALSPILLNCVLIGTFVVLDPLALGSIMNVRFLAYSVVIGGFLQLLVQAAYIWHRGYWPRLRLDFQHPALKKIFRLMAPAVLGAGLFQINQLMDIAIASYMIPESMGAVPGLRFAHRLIQLPTGIVGAALAVTILPILAGLIRSDASHKVAPELGDAFSYAFFLTVPAGLGLFFLGRPIIDALFSGGMWGPDSTNSVWTALQWYCLGVPFYSINKILTSSFFAYQDTKTPVRIMLFVTVLNLALNLILVRFLYQGGLALSTAFCAALNTVLLYYFLRKKIGSFPSEILAASFRRMIPLWILLASYLAFIAYVAGDSLEKVGIDLALALSSSEKARYAGLMRTAAGMIGALILYLGAAHILGLKEYHGTFGRFLRGRDRKEAKSE